MSANLVLTPWARAALTDADRDAIRARIRHGDRLELAGHGRDWAAHLIRGGVVVAVTTRQPTWQAAVDGVLVPVSYMRCATCGKKLTDWGDCDSCTFDRSQREADDV
jgi:hypothetical protein